MVNSINLFIIYFYKVFKKNIIKFNNKFNLNTNFSTSFIKNFIIANKKKYFKTIRPFFFFKRKGALKTKSVFNKVKRLKMIFSSFTPHIKKKYLFIRKSKFFFFSQRSFFIKYSMRLKTISRIFMANLDNHKLIFKKTKYISSFLYYHKYDARSFVSFFYRFFHLPTVFIQHKKLMGVLLSSANVHKDKSIIIKEGDCFNSIFSKFFIKFFIKFFFFKFIRKFNYFTKINKTRIKKIKKRKISKLFPTKNMRFRCKYKPFYKKERSIYKRLFLSGGFYTNDFDKSSINFSLIKVKRTNTLIRRTMFSRRLNIFSWRLYE